MNKNIIGFGIAGNFAHHLEQAGESDDFINVIVEEEDAPKGIFPTYIPNDKTFLGDYPFSEDTIQSIEDKNIQVEPEVGLLCHITYEGDKIKSLEPTHFMAYNDCSIRVEGAKKISHKKNWGANSKGISAKMLDIDTFSLGGVMDDYSLTSFIKRDGKIIQYGENSELLGYSYFYGKLLDWMVEKLNHQRDNGPLEDLNRLILDADKPKKLLISIGATRYTKFGETHYLQKGDTAYIIVYNHSRYDHERISEMIDKGEFANCQASILRQEVI
ncbi:MAG: hypothetical protein K0U47_08220 [Epsilonproteobacteria bacterium]|nr:hypothetical protein [Campylobacterota bacterium]